MGIQQQKNNSTKPLINNLQGKRMLQRTKAYSKFFGDLGENLLSQTDGGAIFGKAMEEAF